MTKERKSSRLAVEYTRKELDDATDKLVSVDLKRQGRQLTKKNIDDYKKEAMETYLVVSQENKAVVLKWHLIRHGAVLTIIKDKLRK